MSIKHATALIGQYRNNVKTQYVAAQGSSDFQKISTSLKNQLESLLATEPPTWGDMYQAEQFLVETIADNALDAELSRRLAQATDIVDKELLKRLESIPRSSVADKRACLLALVTELQWAHTRKRLNRVSLSQAVLISCVFFMGAFALFTGTALAAPRLAPILGQSLFGLYAVTSGMLGASYSTLTTLKATPPGAPMETVETMCSIRYILSRILIGLCAALILFHFLQAGLISGVLLPVIKDSTAPSPTVTSKALLILDKNFSLVIIYCFLAGFSEKLVPDLLTKAQSNIKE